MGLSDILYNEYNRIRDADSKLEEKTDSAYEIADKTLRQFLTDMDIAGRFKSDKKHEGGRKLKAVADLRNNLTESIVIIEEYIDTEIIDELKNIAAQGELLADKTYNGIQIKKFPESSQYIVEMVDNVSKKIKSARSKI